MKHLVAVPLLLLAVLLQSALLSQMRFLSGSADLLLVLLAAWSIHERVQSGWHWAFLVSVLTSFVTHLAWPAVFIGYFAVVLIAKLLSRRVWQAPLLAMFGVTAAGTLFMHLETFAILRIAGTPLPPGAVLGSVTLPSLMLNILLAIPVLAWVRDFAAWTYPLPENA